MTLKPVSTAVFVFLIQAEGLMVTDGLTNIISQYFFLHKKSQKQLFCLFAIGENCNAKIVFVAVFNPHYGSLPNYDNFCINDTPSDRTHNSPYFSFAELHWGLCSEEQTGWDLQCGLESRWCYHHHLISSTAEIV